MSLPVIQMLCPPSKYSIKCPYTMDSQYITVHNTANDAGARAEVSYMITNNNEVSFHLAVDDKEAVQGIPFDRNSWNAGDGPKGTGNRRSISIEICYSKSGGPKFDKAEENAAYLIACLLKERGWGMDRIRKHQDWSGKYCPHRTLDEGWDKFLDRIRKYLYSGSVKYRVHGQTYGWQDWKYDGEMAGTEGQSKRIEAIIIDGDAEFEYEVHQQGTGDIKRVFRNGEMAGSTGQSLRLESIKINCNRAITYRVHQQTYGWTGWVTNGTWCGVKGESKRLEAIEIKFAD